MLRWNIYKKAMFLMHVVNTHTGDDFNDIMQEPEFYKDIGTFSFHTW